MEAEASIPPGVGSDCGRRPPQLCSADAAIHRIWSARTGRMRVCVDATEDGGATVRVAGELDMTGAPLVHDAVQMVRAARRLNARLDLSALHFCDCAGLNAFVAGDELLRAEGGRLTLVDPSVQVRRLLTITKMEHLNELDGDRL